MFSYLLFFPTESTAGATLCSAIYQPQHPLGKCWAKIILGRQTKPSCFDFSLSNFPLQGWWSCSYLISIPEKD
jgi:hypothetical protein